MAYDKKTGTINIGANDTHDDFRRDMFAHMAHIDNEIIKDLPKPKKSAPKSAGFVDKLHNLSKPVKAFIVFTVVWTIFVIYRTSGYHEVIGIDLPRWDDDSFFMNWLGLPIFIGAIYFAVNWVMKDKQPKKMVKANPLEEFEKELNTWPAKQAQIAILLIKATLLKNEEMINRLHQELTLEQLRKVKAVLEKI